MAKQEFKQKRVMSREEFPYEWEVIEISGYRCPTDADVRHVCGNQSPTNRCQPSSKPSHTVKETV